MKLFDNKLDKPLKEDFSQKQLEKLQDLRLYGKPNSRYTPIEKAGKPAEIAGEKSTTKPDKQT